VALDAEVVVIHPIGPAKPKGRPSQSLSEPRHSMGPPLELGPLAIEIQSLAKAPPEMRRTAATCHGRGRRPAPGRSPLPG
jgi:hypothetical protein